jgi:hypothetical protein
MMTGLYAAVRRLRAWALTAAFCAGALPASAAAISYLMSDQPSGSSGLWELVSVNSSPSTDSSTSVSVGSVPANQYLLYSPGLSNGSYAASLPSAFSGKGWRLATPLSGDIPAGTWVLHFDLYNPSAVLLTGYLWARLWIGSNADGSNAVAVTPWTSSGVLSLLSLLSLGDQVSFSVAAPQGGSGQYVFVETAWQVGALTLGSGLSVAQVCNEASGEALDLPGFTPYTPTPSPSPSSSPTASPVLSPTPSATVTPTFSPSPSPDLTQTAVAQATATAQAQAYIQGGLNAAAAGGLQASQNAFDPRRGPLRIWGHLDQPGHVDLELYDLAGRRLDSLLSADLPAGRWDAQWDGRDLHGRDLASDVYLLVLRQSGVTRVFKAALLRD